jgi:hypothetical protein
MSGRRPLKGGAARLLGNHDGAVGKTFRRCYDALEGELGPFTPLGRLEASRVAARFVEMQDATRALTAAQARRADGRGRRPGSREIRALQRRLGLADGSYTAALAQLRTLAPTRKAPSLPDYLASLTSKPNGGA